MYCQWLRQVAFGLLCSVFVVTVAASIYAPAYAQCEGACEDPCYINWDTATPISVSRWYGLSSFCVTVGQNAHVGASAEDFDKWYFGSGEDDYDFRANKSFSANWTGPGEMIHDFALLDPAVCRYGPTEIGSCYGLPSTLGVGTYEIILTVSDAGPCAATRDANTDPMSWTVEVKPDVPTCPSTSVQADNCTSGGGGGGGCGSCGGSGGGQCPSPSFMEFGKVHQPIPAGPGLTGPAWWLLGDDPALNTCGKPKVKVYDTCSGYQALVTDQCGKCQVMAVTGSTPMTLDDGTEVDWTADENGTTFQFTYKNGSQTHYSLDTPPGNTFTIESGPDWVKTPDEAQDPNSTGTTVDYDYSSTVSRAQTSSGEVWDYTHDVGSAKITKVERTDVDAPSVEIAYVESGDAAGKPSTVVAKDSNGNETSRTTYAYNAEGQIETCTNGIGVTNNWLTEYDYDATERTLTVTQQSCDMEPIIYSTTEYHYGVAEVLGLEDDDPNHDVTEPGQWVTWVTHIDPDNSANNQRTVYEYDHDGNTRTWLKSVTDPVGTKTTYTRGVSGHPELVSQVDVTNGATFISRVRYEYDSFSEGVTLVQRLDANDASLGEERNWYYSGTVWLKTHKDVRGNWTHYDRVEGKPWQVSAVKVASSADYYSGPSDQQWDEEIDPIKTYAYYGTGSSDGKSGQLLSETVPDANGSEDQVTTYKYSRSSVFYPSPTETTYKDASGTDRTSSTYYDAFGRVEKTVDAKGRTVWYRYDDRGRATLTVYKWVNDVVDGTPEVYTENSYDCCSLQWTCDENGNKTYYAYDDMKRVTKVWTDISGQDADYPLVEYTYDCFGNKDTVTTRSDSSTARTTEYTYDKLNRVTKIEYPEGIVGDEEFVYYDSGNLKCKRDGNNTVTMYGYDIHNRLEHVYYVEDYTGTLPPSFPQNADVTYSYTDGWGFDSHSSLVTRVEDASGTSYCHYDFTGRLDKYRPPVAGQSNTVITYAYNVLGEKTSVQIGHLDPETCVLDFWYECEPVNQTYNVNYEYYANGWLKNVKNGANTVAEYSYDEVGNRERVDLGNDTYTTYAYDSDPRYRLNSIAYYKDGSPATELATIGYTATARDAMGNPKSMTDWTGTWNYSYDSNNRLIRAIAPNPIPGQPGGTSENYGGVPYDYDWVGNRIHPPEEPNPMVYNNADQLTTWPGMHTYTYDDAGNLTTVKDPSGQTTVASYTYTPAGLLNVATYHDKAGTSRTLSNTWDASSNRVGMSANGTAYSFVYDPTAGIPAVLEESTSSATVYYIREPSGSLIARLNSTDGVRYYHFDELGSTRLLTDSSGNVTDNYAYDTYGSLVAHEAYTGSVNQPYQYVGMLGYYTHWMEPDFGLLQLGVRFYDPEVGRFSQRDMVISYESAFAYANLNPTYMFDPWGLGPSNWPIIGDLTEGRICISSECNGNTSLGSNAGGIRLIPSLGEPPMKPISTPQAPTGACVAVPGGVPIMTPQYTCHSIDGIDIPVSLQLTLDGVPQRPKPPTKGQGPITQLKIPNLAACTIDCNPRKPSEKPRMSCTSTKNHPVCWFDPVTRKKWCDPKKGWQQ